jgi:hypothetical protein
MATAGGRPRVWQPGAREGTTRLGLVDMVGQGDAGAMTSRGGAAVCSSGHDCEHVRM